MNATQASTPLRKTGALAGLIAHGALLMVGLITACYLGISFLQRNPEATGEPALSGEVAVEQPSGGVMPVVQHDTPPSSALTPEMMRVRDYLARRFKVSRVVLEPLLLASEATGRKQGIDPLLLVAMIGIESGFNPFAESSAGAQGLMQVIPRFHMDKLGPKADEDALFDPFENIRVGALVLKESLRRTGGLRTALQAYGGDPDDPQAAYANKVLTFKGQLEVVARRGV